MAEYKFNQADYDKWLRANGLASAKTAEERNAARKRYVEEVLIPTYRDNRDVFIAAVTEFDKYKPLEKTFKDELIAIPKESPSLSDPKQVVTSPLAMTSGGAKASSTGADAMSSASKIAERATALRGQSAINKTLADIKQQNVAGATNIALGGLGAALGLGQYLGGRKELKGLEMPKEPVYETNQNIDSELARLQVLAQSGDPLIREQAMRDIATRQAMAEQAFRVGSGGDVSSFASGVAGSNIAGMNAARQLAADENQRKMQYSNMLADAIARQTADRQFKQQADFNNFQTAYKEYERKGDRAAGQMNAGLSNVMTGLGDVALGGLNYAGKSAAMDKLLADFKGMTPEMQQQMIAKYPKLFGRFAPPSAKPLSNKDLQQYNQSTKLIDVVTNPSGTIRPFSYKPSFVFK